MHNPHSSYGHTRPAIKPRPPPTHMYWVPDEEDWSVVADHIPVALLRVKLDGKSSRVKHSVGTAVLATYTGRQ